MLSHPLIEIPGRYQEANTFMESVGLHLLWPSIATINHYALELIVIFSVMKLFVSLLLLMGERYAAWYLLIVHYPIRLLLFYNILSEWGHPNLPKLDGTDMAELREFHRT